MSATLPTRVEELQTALAEGRSFDYLLFYGHTPERRDVTDASCLSQWFPAPFELEGERYPTAEHWMMAGKARLFGDGDVLGHILSAPDPAAAKKLGRRVRGFDEPTWARERFTLVVDGNVAKFGQNEALGRFLLGTGDRILVEASPRDRIWGIGLGRANPDATDPWKWRGRNLLGFALVETRRILREGAEP